MDAFSLCNTRSSETIANHGYSCRFSAQARSVWARMGSRSAGVKPDRESVPRPIVGAAPSQFIRLGCVELFDIELSPALAELASPERDDPGKHLVGGAEAGDPGKNTLGTAHHVAGLHVVLGGMPWTDETAVAIDAASGQIGVKVPAPAGHGEQFPLGVADCISACAHHRPGCEVGDRPHFHLVRQSATSSKRLVPRLMRRASMWGAIGSFVDSLCAGGRSPKQPPSESLATIHRSGGQLVLHLGSLPAEKPIDRIQEGSPGGQAGVVVIGILD